MQRDMSLIRSLLLFIEKQEEEFQSFVIIIPNYDSGQISYHVHLMVQAGLVEAIDISTKDNVNAYYISGITWAGHDFLDAIRKPRVWQKVLDKATSAGVSLTVDVAKELAISIIKQSVGI